MGPRSWREDDAVSEVVGTILLVAISVMLFAGLSMVVWQQMQTSPAPANADLRLDVEGEWVSLTHVWGESLPVSDTRLMLTIDGTRGDYPLDEPPLAGHLDHVSSGSPTHWDLGETLWIGCPAGESCAFAGQTTDEVTGIDERANAVLFSTLEGVTPGLILNPLPDLVVGTQPMEDLTPSDGLLMECTYRFRAVVGNTGLEPVADTASLVTKFYVDGGEVHTDTRSGPLAVGATYVVESDQVVVSGAGSHTFRATIDEPDNVVEIADDPAANRDDRSFSLIAGEADPGFAYEDGNDDGFYYPCVSDDAKIENVDIDGGAYSTTAPVGIVIPPSVGTISVAGPITFASGGSLTVGVDLSATGLNSVTLDADNALNFIGSPAPTVTATGDIDIDADGDIDIGGVTLSAEGFAITIDSLAGSILADGLVVPDLATDATRIDVNAGGYITAQGADVHVQNGIRFDATGTTGSGSLLLQDATLEADPGSGLFSGHAIRLNGDGDVHVERMYMRTAADLIGISVDSVSNTLFYENLDCDTLGGSQNNVVLTPVGANKDGGSGAQCSVV